MPEHTHPLKVLRIVILAAVLLMSAPMLPETNIVKADDNHPAMWKFLYTPPVVSTFSGSATYNYSLEVPPGRGGMQPSVNFSYNSSRVNGMLGYLMVDGGPLGLGWSADQMDITRTSWKICITMGNKPCFKDKFVLAMNGTSYELEPADSAYWGRFYAQGAPGLYVERRNFCDASFSPECAANPGSGSANNVTGDYWIVHTPDGTEYRLGSEQGSEQVMRDVRSNGGYGGTTTNTTVKRWRVDRAKDVHGNVMRFLYQEFVDGDNNDKWSLLQEIKYNKDDDNIYLSRVAFSVDTSHIDKVGPLYSKVDVFDGVFDNNPDTEVVRTYNLDVELRVEAECGVTLNEAYLQEIEMQEPGGQALPATTFSYHWLTNWSGDCFRYPRMKRIENGYGGKTEFDYVGDGYTWANNICPVTGKAPKCPHLDPGAVGQSYRVTAIRTYDGIHDPQSAEVAYEYGTPCRYAEVMSSYDPQDSRYSIYCPASGSKPRRAAITGYVTATQTLQNYDGTTIGMTTHHFLINDQDLLGREYLTEQKDTDGTVLMQKSTIWSDDPLGTPIAWSHVNQVVSTDYTGSTPLSTKTTYEYALAEQGGTQYGNVTHVREYTDADDAEPYRATVTTYISNPNPLVWIVGQPKEVKVYDGDTDDILLVHTKSYYDDRTTWGTIPTLGEVVRIDQIDLDGGETVTAQAWYDTWGNVITTTNALDQDSTVEYDDTYHIYPVQTCTPAVDGVGRLCTTMGYYGVEGVLADDGLPGQIKSVTDPNEAKTSYKYDAFGRLAETILPLQQASGTPSTIYKYNDDVFPLLIRVKQLRDESPVAYYSYRTFYDGLGRKIQQRYFVDDGLAAVVDTEYTTLGQVSRQTLPHGTEGNIWVYETPDWADPYASYTYDALGRAVRVNNPDSTYTHTIYEGLVTTAIDANGHQKRYTNDVWGQLIKVEEFTGIYPTTTLYATTEYEYDKLGHLVTVSDEKDNITKIDHDALGRKVAMHDPDMGHWIYDYDLLGNLTSQTDARGCTVSFAYDELNRPTGKSYTGCAGSPEAVTYTYDQGINKLGRLSRMDDSSGWTEYDYDLQGHVIAQRKHITGTNTFTTTWTYDPMGRITSMTYPDGEVVPYTYEANTLESMGTYVTSIDYTAPGQIETLAMGNGVVTQYAYNNLNLRLQNVQASKDTTTLLDLNYTYDDAGNVMSITDGTNDDQVQHFTYDHLDRLTHAWTTGGGNGVYDRTYDYDEIDNLTFKGSVGTYTYTVSGAGSVRPHAVTKTSSGWSFQYDANGNMTQRVVFSGTERIAYTLSFNAENKVATVTNQSAAEVTTFVYDGDGNRVKRITPEGTTYYVGGYYEEFHPAGGIADAGDALNPSLHTALSAALGGEPEPGRPPTVVAADPGLLLMAPAMGMLAVLGRRRRCYRHTRARRTLAWSVGNVILAVAVVSILAWFTVKPVLAAGPEVTKYYYAGTQRVAMRKGNAVYYLHGDHLGSTSLVTNELGEKEARVLYYPYGEERYTINPEGSAGTLQTDFGFTGQRNEQDIGLMDYNARYYDPALGRFVSADTIVPDLRNPQSLNRFAYVLNNPLRYTDPTGHQFYEGRDNADVLREYLEGQGYSEDEINQLFERWQKFHNDWWNLLMEAQLGDYIEGYGPWGARVTYAVGRFYDDNGKLGFEYFDQWQCGFGPQFGTDNPIKKFEKLESDPRYQKKYDLRRFFEWGPKRKDHLKHIILGRPEENCALPNPRSDKLVFWGGTGWYDTKKMRYVWETELAIDVTKGTAEAIEEGKVASLAEAGWIGAGTYFIWQRRVMVNACKGYTIHLD